MVEPLGSVRFRLFLGGKVVKDDIVEIASGEDLAKLPQQHAAFLLPQAEQQNTTWMVEVEILNDPTDPDRFLRFGTDPAGMFNPMEMDLTKHPWSKGTD